MPVQGISQIHYMYRTVINSIYRCADASPAGVLEILEEGEGARLGVAALKS
jgi:hypothetical protein